jgi:D-serine deaminase-like pyridoxal phosphate-dependent protein
VHSHYGVRRQRVHELLARYTAEGEASLSSASSKYPRQHAAWTTAIAAASPNLLHCRSASTGDFQLASSGLAVGGTRSAQIAR